MATIAVIGSGAVGSFYGALLARAGHDVRFLMRRDYMACKENGLQVFSTLGDFHLASVQAFDAPEDIGEVDWVICSLKATALSSARELCEPCIGPETRVIALMNGLGVESEFADWVEPERVFGAMAFVCINRGTPGVVHHLEYGRVSIGHYLDDPLELDGLAQLLSSAGIEVNSAPNLRFARWEKLCWNIPFNGLSVAAGGIGTATIMADPALRDVAERAMREVVAAGNADLVAAGSLARLDPEDIVDRLFKQTGTMGDYRTSMVIDYVLGRPLEVEQILGEPVRRARFHGLAVPTMTSLYALVRAADMRRTGQLAVIRPEDVEAPVPVALVR